MLKAFFNFLIKDSEFKKIQYDTLVVLNPLVYVVENDVQLQLAFALTSGAKQGSEPLKIYPPFARCYMNNTDTKLTWQHDLESYSDQKLPAASLTDLAKEVLKTDYKEPTGWAAYNTYIQNMNKLNYYNALEQMVNSIAANRNKFTTEEKRNMLTLLYFFNGVPVELSNYYNVEGKYMADMLRVNCL